MRRMRHVQLDMAYLWVELVDDDDRLGRLNEMNGLAAVIDIDGRNTRWPAPLPGDERDFSGEHRFIGLSHLLHGPGLQNRIGQVRSPVGRLALAVGNIGIGLVERGGARPAGRRQEVVMVGAVQRPGVAQGEEVALAVGAAVDNGLSGGARVNVLISP
jgi:hypothetical protein